MATRAEYMAALRALRAEHFRHMRDDDPRRMDYRRPTVRLGDTTLSCYMGMTAGHTRTVLRYESQRDGCVKIGGWTGMAEAARVLEAIDARRGGK